MSAVRQKFSSQADPQVLAEIKAIAQEEGRQFQAVLEQAMREFIERKRNTKPREQVLAYFRTSVDKNRRLGKLLAQ